MAKGGFALRGQSNADDVKAAGEIVEVIRLDKGAGRSGQMFLLGEINGFFGWGEFFRGAGFHLDKDQGVVVLHNQIDFTTGSSKITAKMAEAFLF